MTRRRRRTKSRRPSRVPKSITFQNDYRNTHLGGRRRLSSIDRKIYRIAHQNNGTRQRIFQVRVNSTTTVAANQQAFTFASLGGFNISTTGTGDITRIMTQESLGTTSDVKLYLRSMRMQINMRNGSTREQVHTVYKITAGKRFREASEVTIASVLSTANSVGPVPTSNHWTPFMVTDKLSQYGITVHDVTKYNIQPLDYVTYTDNKSFGSRTISSDMQGSFGDNEPGVTVHYITIAQDLVGDTLVIQPAQNVEFIRSYTYSVEGIPSQFSAITYL